LSCIPSEAGLIREFQLPSTGQICPQKKNEIKEGLALDINAIEIIAPSRCQGTDNGKFGRLSESYLVPDH
jgi:hypothetical protein